MPNHTSSYASQAELIRAVIAQEKTAEEEFFELVWGIVNAHAHSWGVRPCDAEDLASEVVVKALNRLHRFKVKRAKLSTWIFVIGRNHAYDMLDKDKNDPLRQESLELQAWMEIGGEDAVLHFDEVAVESRPEVFDRLDQALKQLDPSERELLQLSINASQTAAQIAPQMGMSVGQVRVRKHRLLGRMRDLLSA
ncbi:RNA polymerase sigma factor (sigma-70 family) [Prosthecobacter fusiformis]|uniref:RNA polymerase sigma factor (Sigma-70 family) n=1 Tax=Prosthecobacter fusiformis TaxID=48464 RepID=A0A4R7S5V2_9BACT|nr:sigma-70 family RNA polymerase sigma factor [Prosthecobacter fusiformis]TDU73259.1 RNA polymerase sigma factor (sigma-70 family) [Prosthecobacter fusiformis]